MISVETFAIVQLQLQLLSAIAGVFETMDVEPPPGITQLAVAIHQRSQALIPVIQAEVGSIAPPSSPAAPSGDIFGLDKK